MTWIPSSHTLRVIRTPILNLTLPSSWIFSIPRLEDLKRILGDTAKENCYARTLRNPSSSWTRRNSYLRRWNLPHIGGECIDRLDTTRTTQPWHWRFKRMNRYGRVRRRSFFPCNPCFNNKLFLRRCLPVFQRCRLRSLFSLAESKTQQCVVCSNSNQFKNRTPIQTFISYLHFRRMHICRITPTETRGWLN